MRNTAIIDAGPLIALFDKSDRYHENVKRKLEDYRSTSHGKLITTWPIITEVTYLLKEHVHIEAEMDFLKWITLGGLELFDLESNHLTEIINLQKKYSNVPMDFADATLLITAEELHIVKVFTIDKDFSIYRLLNKSHLENLMA